MTRKSWEIREFPSARKVVTQVHECTFCSKQNSIEVIYCASVETRSASLANWSGIISSLASSTIDNSRLSHSCIFVPRWLSSSHVEVDSHLHSNPIVHKNEIRISLFNYRNFKHTSVVGELMTWSPASLVQLQYPVITGVTPCLSAIGPLETAVTTYPTRLPIYTGCSWSQVIINHKCVENVEDGRYKDWKLPSYCTQTASMDRKTDGMQITSK